MLGYHAERHPLNDRAILGGAEVRGISVAKRPRREQIVGVREVPFHSVRYQAPDSGRWQQATMKAGVGSESIHPAIFDSKLHLRFHISAMGLATTSARGWLPRGWLFIEAAFAAAYPGLLLCPSATRRSCCFQPCSHFKSDVSAPGAPTAPPLVIRRSRRPI